MVSKADAGGTTQYVWDFENRLKQVTLPNGDIVGYKYDALGRRIERTVFTPPSGTSTTRFIHDGVDVIRDTDANGVTTADYLNGPGIDNIRQTANGASLSFLADQLGSTRALTDAQGNVIEQISYDSFGNGSGSTFTRYDYTGRERDPQTGLIFYRARWYDPQSGRFMSEDPIGFKGEDVNIYAYVKNNPVSHADPLGTFPVAVVAVGGGLIAEWGVHYYLMNRAWELFPEDPQGRKKHCYVNCMSTRIHGGSPVMATGFSVAQEVPTLVRGALTMD